MRDLYVTFDSPHRTLVRGRKNGLHCDIFRGKRRVLGRTAPDYSYEGKIEVSFDDIERRQTVRIIISRERALELATKLNELNANWDKFKTK